MLDNANPTILSLSSLPTRGQKHAVVRRGPESKYDDLLFPKHVGSWDALRNVSSWPSDDDDDELSEEPIDQQEIYGQFLRTPNFFFFLPWCRCLPTPFSLLGPPPHLFNQVLGWSGSNEMEKAPKCLAFHASPDAIPGFFSLWFRIHTQTADGMT